MAFGDPPGFEAEHTHHFDPLNPEHDIEPLADARAKKKSSAAPALSKPPDPFGKEKHLKKTFIVATLVGTIVTAFGSAHALYEKIEQKRTDKKQNAEIKKLKEEIQAKDKRVGEAEKAGAGKNDGGKPSDKDNAEVGRSLQASGSAIKKTQQLYEEDLGKLDKVLQQRFAKGDLIAQAELQAQVIQLQQTVITILEEAVYSGRTPSRADMLKLFHASEAARQGTVEALSGQYKRVVEAEPKPSTPSKAPTTSKCNTTATKSDAKEDPLYCKYASSLQDDPSKALSPAFRPGGRCACEACCHTMPVVPGRAFQIYKREACGEVPYHILNRFVVKCHRPDGEFACVLCTRNRKVDTIWADVRALAKHVGRAHDAIEYYLEPDIKEVV